MTTYIIIANVQDVDRRKLERMENGIYESVADVHVEIAANALILTLHDFTTAVNDEELQDFSDKWIGYAHVK